ncbi:MAG: hypothetical protein ABII23_06130 [bacterium]
MKHFLFILIIFSIFIPAASSLHAEGFNDDFGLNSGSGFGDDQKPELGFAASGFLGFNEPHNGYKTYRRNPAFGGDARLLLHKNNRIKYYCSFALDIIPLGLPEELLETTQNIITTQINFAYILNQISWRRLVPYVGVGTGYFWDMIEQDIPGFGSKTNKEFYFGFNWHLGVEYRFMDNISISPQIKMHYMSQPGIYATIVMYSANLIFYFGKDVYYNEF